MFIHKNPPNMFSNGDILSPESLNENNNYLLKAIQFEAEKQTARWTSNYELVPSVSSTITSASSANIRTRNIPNRLYRSRGSSLPIVTIESISVIAYYTATAEFELAVNITSGTTPGERIVFPVRDAGLSTEPYQVVRLMNQVNAGFPTDLLFCLQALNSATGTALPAGTTITKFDVIVGFASDRYISGNGTSAVVNPLPVSLTQFTDGSSADAATYTALKTAVETAATAAKAGFPYRWVAFDLWSIISTTNAKERAVLIPSFSDPSFTGVTSAANVVGAFINAKLTAGTIGNTIQFGWADNNATAFVASYNKTFTLAAGGAQTVNDGVLLGGTSRYTAADVPTNDRTLAVIVNGTVNIEHCTIYLLLQ
jgi:hypothetical protein